MAGAVAQIVDTTQPVAGVDEAGRGPLAGAVVAAVVVLAPGQLIAGVKDSKLLSASQRLQLAARIRAEALDWAIGRAEVAEIDALNILQATLLAMARAVAALSVRPPVVLVDGNVVPGLPGYTGVVQAIPGGDRTHVPIAAASIIAKVARDEEMRQLDARYPGYGFDRHKGYPTAAHRTALNALGPCAAHRLSFRPVQEALAIRGCR